MLRHALATLMTLGLAMAVAIYLDPYSLHRVIAVDGGEFDTPPADDGVVRIGSEQIDFRLPELSLDDASRQVIGEQIPSEGTDFDVVTAIVGFERTSLNAVDQQLSNVDESSAGTILADGQSHFCLCSAYARLFVEIAQSVGLQARVLWLEGHVAAEYFDRDRLQWLYVDPQLGVAAADDEGQWLSLAKIIDRLERGATVDFRVIADAGDKAIDYREFSKAQPHWYRNVLLNGETRAYSGATLAEPGRWQVLAKHRQRPAVLVLNTQFDSSEGFPGGTLSTRRVLITFVAIWTAFYAFVLLVGPRRKGVGKSTSAETFPAEAG